MCIYSKLVTNPKYRSNKKNGGIVPPLNDKRMKQIPAGCGKCIECRKQKGNGWAVRLMEDIKDHKNGHMVTLTFSDLELKKLEDDVQAESVETLEGYALDNTAAVKGIRRFLELWRYYEGKTLRHWLVTELGETKTERIHIHGIVYTDEPELLRERWKYGHVWIGKFVNERTIKYVTKYLTKTDFKHKEYEPKMCVSPGIGRGYIERIGKKKNRFNEEKTDVSYKARNGQKYSMPIYWRNQLWSEEEREKLWGYTLDKEERWIDGVKIDLKWDDAEELETKARKQAQIKNDRLGYGSDKKNWSQKRYENDIRNMKKLQRDRKIKAYNEGAGLLN